MKKFLKKKVAFCHRLPRPKKVIGWGPMPEQWREIGLFPGYQVSDMGQVVNIETGHTLTKLVTQRGIVHVGLTKNRTQYKRSLALLVAEAFLPRPSFEFDTPINLNGDRTDCRVENLMWRPRWFAVKYMQQFLYNSVGCIDRPVQIIETLEVFKNSWDAATSLGLLDREIAISIMNKNYVWPIHQHFRTV